MKRVACIAVAVVAGLALAGCEPAGGPAAPTNSPDNPLLVDMEFEPLFLAAGRTLRDHRFTIFREDSQRGEIVTEPLTGQQMWEIWRSDAAGVYNQLESSLHTVLRTVEVSIWPACDSSGNRIAGKNYLEVRACDYRQSEPERAFTAANQLPSTYRVGQGLVNSLDLEEQHANRPRQVFLRRDNLLEDWLMRDIVRTAGASCPVPSPTTMPAGR
jgi:hypothetical protein